MNRSVVGVLFVIVITVGNVSDGHASTLQEGTWGGSITQPDGSVETVTFDVAYPEGKLSMTMKEDGGSIPLNEPHFKDGKLRFSWDSGGLSINCAMEPSSDGSYKGECYQPGGEDVFVEIKMTPPAS